MGKPHIIIIGDYDPEYPAHVATRDAIIHAERALRVVVNTRWMTPDQLADGFELLEGACAALIAPRNPKAPRQLWPEILAALEWLRSRRVPTLGIEYGYQHMVIELARNVLGRSRANSTAYDDATDAPVITALELDEPPIDKFRPRIIDVTVEPDTRLASLYAQTGVVRESFRGHYVLNPDYAAELEHAGFVLSARGQLGDRQFVAAIEWNALPFFLGVAYLPQFASSSTRCHPVIKGLIEAGTTPG